MVQEDPAEFVNSSLDLCEDQESNNIKSNAALLLLSISKHVDGMETFIIDFCLNFLEKTVQKSNQESQQYIQKIIEEFQLQFKSE